MPCAQTFHMLTENRNQKIPKCSVSAPECKQTLINIFLSTFPGLGLPRTATVQVYRLASCKDVYQTIQERVPCILDELLLTTHNGRIFTSESKQPVSSLLETQDASFLCLRLSARLFGGKGGFGSQLRAAGGRMSAKRKKKASDNGGSNRNLDGRRLRTVAEAKALAEFISIKPGMDEKEKADRKSRLQNIIQSAEDKQEEIRSLGKGKLVEQWVEDKDDLVERTRQAVLQAKVSEVSCTEPSPHALASVDESRDLTVPESLQKRRIPDQREVAALPGFDDDLEYMSDPSETAL